MINVEDNDKTSEHIRYMREALGEALLCAESDDVPVGAVLVYDGRIIGRGHNEREKKRSPLWHAEMLAAEEGAASLGRWNLTGATLYVTKEPCVMCAGLAVQSRITRVVYGAGDVKGGGCGGALQIACCERLNHRVELIGGILEKDCVELIQKFFQARRKKT